MATAPDFFLQIAAQLQRAGLLREAARPVAAAGDRKAVRHDLASARDSTDAHDSPPSTRSTGSTITSARRRCRTSWCCVLPTACSSRSGIAATSTTSRSPWTRSSASAARQLLRCHRRAARHGAEPSVPALSLVAMEPPDLRRPAPAQREGQGAGADPDPCAPGVRKTPCAASTARAGSSGAEMPDYARTGRQAGFSTTETYAALKICHRQLALGRRAVLPAHRQAARAAAPKWRSSSAGAVRDVLPPVDALADRTTS